MDFIVDFLFGTVFELFAESFFSMCSVFIPKRIISDKVKRIMGLIFMILALILFIGLLAGIVLIVETKGKSIAGWVFIVLSSVYFLVGVVLKIVSVLKK